MRTHHHPALGRVDVYPVGLLADLRLIGRLLNPLTTPGIPLTGRYRGIRRTIRNIRAAPRRRSAWNGYLAEPRAFPAHMTRCGHGWTRRRALHDLNQHHQGRRP